MADAIYVQLQVYIVHLNNTSCIISISYKNMLGAKMKTKINHILLIFLLIVCSSLILAQSPYHRNNYDHSYSINNYLVPDFEQKLSLDFIRMDSLISTSVQGTSLKFLFQYNENNKMTEWLSPDNFGSGWRTV